MKILQSAASALLEFAYPENCGLCGADPAVTPWTLRGRVVRDLRWWDRTQLCQVCLEGVGSGGGRVQAAVADRPAVWAAAVTSPSLVEVVGLLKYHGLRGLAWPLAGLMDEALGPWDIESALVPVALHRRRQRSRGFNQAEVLARLVAASRGWSVATDVLKRRRATAQQARITDDGQRRANLVEAFEARPPRSAEKVRTLLLVDDLVTSGATAQAAIQSLRAAGWPVAGVLALGLAAGDRKDVGPVDTGGGGF
jgi:predicted amidophosphoribosyltransferase